MSKMNEGFVFSMDAFYAIFIITLTSLTLISLINTSRQTQQDPLYLYRLARDYYEVKVAGVSDSDIKEVLPAKISVGSDCDDAEEIASVKMIEYDNNGTLRWGSARACLK